MAVLPTCGLLLFDKMAAFICYLFHAKDEHVFY